jgi:hypothetical protein
METHVIDNNNKKKIFVVQTAEFTVHLYTCRSRRHGIVALPGCAPV